MGEIPEGDAQELTEARREALARIIAIAYTANRDDSPAIRSRKMADAVLAAGYIPPDRFAEVQAEAGAESVRLHVEWRKAEADLHEAIAALESAERRLAEVEALAGEGGGSLTVGAAQLRRELRVILANPPAEEWPACATYPNLGCVCRGALGQNKATCTRKRTGDMTPIQTANPTLAQHEIHLAKILHTHYCAEQPCDGSHQIRDRYAAAVVLEALRTTAAQHDAEVGARTLREAADRWETACTRNHPLDAEVADRIVPWLRARADDLLTNTAEDPCCPYDCGHCHDGCGCPEDRNHVD